MPAIQLADPLYEQLRIRAAEAGFASVDDYVTAMLRDDNAADRTFDGLFTPDRLAKLDRIVQNMDNGGRLTENEVDAHFKARREARPRTS